MQFALNNWYLFLGILIVLGMLVYAPLTQLMHGVRHVNNSEAIRLLNQEKGVLVDVREAQEYSSGHALNAISVPLSGLASNLQTLEKYKARPVIVCCRTSQRSARAAVALRKHGFSNVQVLAGGMVAWQGENLPTVK